MIESHTPTHTMSLRDFKTMTVFGNNKGQVPKQGCIHAEGNPENALVSQLWLT